MFETPCRLIFQRLAHASPRMLLKKLKPVAFETPCHLIFLTCNTCAPIFYLPLLADEIHRFHIVPVDTYHVNAHLHRRGYV